MNCRHCGHSLSLPFLDLGSAPPSNAYLTLDGLRAPETWYPLRLLVCQSCWLVQTEDHAGREALFSGDYAYFSAFSSSWLDHSRRYVEQSIRRFDLGADSLVVEVAANDGYLLQYVKAAGIPCLGVEPTASTATAARERGIPIVERFFGKDLAVELAAEGYHADLMTANNVLAHVPDINDFVTGFAQLLKPGGVVTFEFPHLLRMVRERQFDTAYHEHYSYLSLGAARRVLAANGLTVFDVEALPTHGGSLRVYACRSDAACWDVTPAVATMLSEEKQAGMEGAAFYQGFQAAAEDVKNGLVKFLMECKRDGLRVAAYGAAAKGNTLLNFAGVRPDLLPWVIDRNPAKQGRYLPGSRIPIVGEEILRDQRPDRILVLPWNLIAEVAEQLAYTRAWGCRLTTAVPTMRIHS